MSSGVRSETGLCAYGAAAPAGVISNASRRERTYLRISMEAMGFMG